MHQYHNTCNRITCTVKPVPAEVYRRNACANPESFVRGGPNLITFFLVDEGMEDQNTAINGPSSARQRNAI